MGFNYCTISITNGSKKDLHLQSKDLEKGNWLNPPPDTIPHDSKPYNLTAQIDSEVFPMNGAVAYSVKNLTSKDGSFRIEFQVSFDKLPTGHVFFDNFPDTGLYSSQVGQVLLLQMIVKET